MTATRKSARTRWLAAALLLAGLSGGYSLQAPGRPAEAAQAPDVPQGNVLLFDANSTEVSAANLSALQRHVRYLRGHPEVAVIVEGFTHERGPVADDLKLGLDRTLAVSRVLEAAGIDRDRIRLVSYEGRTMNATGTAVEGSNRRVALRYVPAAQAGAPDAAELGVPPPLLGIPVQ